MAGSLFIVFGVVLLLLCALVTVNMVMFRKSKIGAERVERATVADANFSQPSESAISPSDENDQEPETGTRFVEESESTLASADVTVDVSIPETFEADGTVATVEVLTNSQGTPRIFEKPTLRFQLMAADVPEFANATWKDCFQRLTEDEGVVGWIAFQEHTLGASDRMYDPEFIGVLTDYRRTLEKLRNEVGISKLQEASVVGEEGKMWFITAVDDVWFALFVERDTNIELLSNRLFAPIQSKLTTS